MATVAAIWRATAGSCILGLRIPAVRRRSESHPESDTPVASLGGDVTFGAGAVVVVFEGVAAFGAGGGAAVAAAPVFGGDAVVPVVAPIVVFGAVVVDVVAPVPVLGGDPVLGATAATIVELFVDGAGAAADGAAGVFGAGLSVTTFADGVSVSEGFAT